MPPRIRFLFVRPAFCLGLPSDSPSRETPLPSASTSPYRACRGLSPPSHPEAPPSGTAPVRRCAPCLAHHKKKAGMAGPKRRELKGYGKWATYCLTNAVNRYPNGPKPAKPCKCHLPSGAGFHMRMANHRVARRPAPFLTSSHRLGRSADVQFDPPVGDEASLPGHPCPSGHILACTANPSHRNLKSHIALSRR